MPAAKSKPTTFDGYLAALAGDQRAALERIRRTIRQAVPNAEEGISYGLAAFRLDGKPLVALGATATHCAFYPISGNTVGQFADELTDFETSKGTIRFSADKPLSDTLVRKLLAARLAENSGGIPAKAARRGTPKAKSKRT